MSKALQELYEYRELLINLVIKELKIKYKNSILGFFWSLIHPLLMMLVFTFIFSYVFRANIENYPVFFLVGFLPWNFFVTVLSINTGSVVSNGSLIKKVYFPREILPISVVFANLVNLLLSLVVLFFILFIYGYNFYLFLPILFLAIILHTLLTIGFSLALSSLNVYFRDIEQLIGILLLVWFYGTPVLYDMSMIPPQFQLLIKYANPMTPIIFLYRESLYYLNWPSMSLLVFAVTSSLATFIGGYWLFRRLAPSFAKEV